MRRGRLVSRLAFVGDFQKGDPVEARLAGSASVATKFGPTLHKPWTSRVYITSLAATGFITAAPLICQGAVLTVLTVLTDCWHWKVSSAPVLCVGKYLLCFL